MTLTQVFGANLAHQRRAKGISQEHLAALVGVSNNTVSRIERGRQAPSIQVAERLAGALGISPLALFGTGKDALPDGERGRLLARINAAVSKLSDDDLARLAKMIEAFSGR